MITEPCLEPVDRIDDEEAFAELAANAPPSMPREPVPPTLGEAIAQAARALRMPFDTDVPVVFRCDGGCGAAVSARGHWCRSCAADGPRRARRFALRSAFTSIDPGGVLGWCRAGTPEYVAATSRARERSSDSPGKLKLFADADWPLSRGGLLILGPTGFGKTRLLVAIAHHLLDAGVAGALGPEDFKAAQRARLASGLELAKARSDRERFGGEPHALHEAKEASILFLDEIGFEDQRDSVIREIVDYRNFRQRPTLATTGKTLDELDALYGAATRRRIYECAGKGDKVNLFSKSEIETAKAAIVGGRIRS